MKRILEIFGILSLLISSFLVIPVIGENIEEDNSNDLGLRWKILYVIGNVKYNFESRLNYFYAIFGYVGGEIIKFGNIYIQFERIPLFINNGIFSSF
jgi:hypothetical protein